MLAVLVVLALILYACSGSGSGKKQPTANGTSSSAASQTSLPTSGGTSSQAASGGASGSAPSASGGAPSGGASGGSTSTAGGASGGVNGGVVGTTGGNAGNAGNAGNGPTAGGGSTGGPGCQLNLSLTTQSAAYANGVNPQFTVAVVNKGTSDCDVDVSPKSLVLNVYSGSERIWSSADCATGGKDLRGIAPGAVQTVTYTWDRTRSSQGCPANAASAKLGMYYGVVSLAPGSGPSTLSAQSQPKSFELKTGS